MSVAKYALNLLRSTSYLGAKPADTPVEMGHKLFLEDGDLLEHDQMYCQLVGESIFLKITRPYISQVASMVSQYMHAPRTSHLEIVRLILRHIKSSPGKGSFMKLMAI